MPLAELGRLGGSVDYDVVYGDAGPIVSWSCLWSRTVDLAAAASPRHFLGFECLFGGRRRRMHLARNIFSRIARLDPPLEAAVQGLLPAPAAALVVGPHALCWARTGQEIRGSRLSWCWPIPLARRIAAPRFLATVGALSLIRMRCSFTPGRYLRQGKIGPLRKFGNQRKHCPLVCQRSHRPQPCCIRANPPMRVSASLHLPERDCRGNGAGISYLKMENRTNCVPRDASYMPDPSHAASTRPANLSFPSRSVRYFTAFATLRASEEASRYPR
ncbi:hypothetical protein DFJ74DRAFT_84234 [Hyaloraphidium curvatum]|nr:hypothetical protein DFJ74DRAFT_84234 [Hyaloraphidium curvatum]